jgi:tRNA pseudouridine38-40 synthase
MNYALRLAYKGTHFHGWQIQDNAKSVQGELNRALEVILRHPVKTLGSGRTDTGVHAMEQYAMFESDADLKPYEHLKAINALLPGDISVYGLYQIEDSANVRFDAIERRYEYRICRRRDPFQAEFSALLLAELNPEIMNRGADFLLSQKDFASFAKSGAAHQTSICDVRQAKWKMDGHVWTFEIAADRFLRNMVRAIVGTLVEMGEGKLDMEDLEKIFKEGKRSGAGRSMPAAGLFLKEVKYPEGYFREL